jgi:hypothetical protein
MTEEKDGKNAGRVVLVIMPSAGRHYARAVEDNEADKDNDKGKKDGKNSKSAQFSLLAGSTLVLLLAAGAAIAMLYSLGDEPLPPSLRLTPK